MEDGKKRANLSVGEEGEEAPTDAGHQNVRRSEFKALDIKTITPYCIKTLHVTILIDISSLTDINTDITSDEP